MRGKRSTAALLLIVGTLLAGCATSRPKVDPNLARKQGASHFNLAADHSNNGRIELALRELLAAERLDPDNAQVQHALGIAYLRKGKRAEGEAHILRALAISPSYQDARYNLSTLYLSQGRYEECIQHSQILFDDPTFAQPWRALTNWGWAAYKQGDVDEARRHLEYARDYNHRYWPTLLNLGILEADAGNLSAAIENYNAMLELRPGPSAIAEASYRLGLIYLSMGRRSDAIGHLRTAVLKAPGDPWGKKSEAYLKRLR